MVENDYWKDWRSNQDIPTTSTTRSVSKDSINPSYYKGRNFDVIDFIEQYELGFCLGNAVKYIARAGKKDPKKYREDLDKAVWYINRRIEELDNDLSQ